MKRIVTLAIVGVVFFSSGAPASDIPCPGDCNGDGRVAVNDIISCVNIALGSAAVGSCPDCDRDGDGTVTISDLVTEVSSALFPECPPPSPLCGNRYQESGEECDDGNSVGGDGCAVNCTTEDVRVGVFDRSRTITVVQTEALPIGLNLTGQQTFRTGHMRDVTARLFDGGTFPAGQIPVAIRAEDLRFDPVRVTGLLCACVRGVPVAAFGPGVSASGAIACGPPGLADIDYRVVQDHDTSPGSAGNHIMGTMDDAPCVADSPAPDGGVSTACREGSDADCSAEANVHTGACQGPRVITFSGGPAPLGSALIVNSTAIGLLSDAGACATNRPMRDGRCLFKDYGPDCLPCTDDDLSKGNTEINPTTTGTAEAALYDANPPGGAIIDPDHDCFGVPCATRASGSVFDCSQLGPGTSGGLSGGSLAVCSPTLDAAQIGDNVTCTVFANE